MSGPTVQQLIRSLNKTSFEHHAVLYVAETKKADKHVYERIFAAWLFIYISETSVRFFNVCHPIELKCDFSIINEFNSNRIKLH